MILRKLCTDPTIRGTVLRKGFDNQIILRNCVRPKSVFQWYNQIMKKFDEPKVIKPPYNHCVQVGDPILRQIAPEVPKDKIKSNEIKTLISQMKNVLHAYNLVGIAAPQIGVSYRIICMESPEQLKERYPAAVYKTRQMDILPMTTVINPVLNVTNFNIKTFPEGCGSVCGYIADVNRYEEVQLSGLNENGDAIEMHLKGWNARIAQHEVDHLNGQLFIDIMDKKTFMCATWQAVNIHGGQLSIPFHPPKKLFKKSVVT